MYTTQLTNVHEWSLNGQSVPLLFLWSRLNSEPVKRHRERNPSSRDLCFWLEFAFNCYGKERRCNSSLFNRGLCGSCFSAMSVCGDACSETGLKNQPSLKLNSFIFNHTHVVPNPHYFFLLWNTNSEQFFPCNYNKWELAGDKGIVHPKKPKPHFIRNPHVLFLLSNKKKIC